MQNIFKKFVLVILSSLLIFSEVNVSFADGGKSIEQMSPENLKGEVVKTWGLVKMIALMVIVAMSILAIAKGAVALGITGFVVMTLILVLGSKFIVG